MHESCRGENIQKGPSLPKQKVGVCGREKAELYNFSIDNNQVLGWIVGGPLWVCFPPSLGKYPQNHKLETGNFTIYFKSPN